MSPYADIVGHAPFDESARLCLLRETEPQAQLMTGVEDDVAVKWQGLSFGHPVLSIPKLFAALH